MKRIGVVGLGLIGGSFALAQKARGAHIIGADASRKTLTAAKRGGAVDKTASIINLARADVDAIFIATPVAAIGDVLKQLAPHIKRRTIIFDAGSTKAQVIRAANIALKNSPAVFVPCHPVAGAENSGFAAAHADLFKGKQVVMCAPKNGAAQKTAAALWRKTGARVAVMNAKTHDRIFAQVSHLPHLLAFALVNALAASPDRKALLQHAASGFRDFTRIAGSDETMWRDICANNRAEILRALAAFEKQAKKTAQLLRARKDDDLAASFAAARRVRRKWRATLER